MHLNKDQVYVLNPDYVLRNDIHRIALYTKENVNAYSSRNWNSFIHPIHAKLFSFFTYDRTLGENIKQISLFLRKDIDAISRLIIPYLENSTPIYVYWKGKRILFPKNILIKREKLDGLYIFLHLKIDDFNCENIDLCTRRYYTGPLSITFMLNNTCMTNCVYCYADTKTSVKGPLSTERWLELIEEAKLMQVRQVNLMGGEIFLYRDWDVLLKKLVDLEMAPKYLSTKMPMTEDLIDRLQKTGYTNGLQVSLDAYNKDILKNGLKVRPDYLNHLEKGLRLLDKSEIKYHVATVLYSYNGEEKEVQRLFDFLETLSNLKDWRISPVVNSIMIDHENFFPLKLRRERIEQLFLYVEKCLIPFSFFSILLNRTALNKSYYSYTKGSAEFGGVICSALNTHLFILPDGKATICEQLYWIPRFIIGNAKWSTLKEIWHSKQSSKLAYLQKEDLQEKSPCKKCGVFEDCYNTRNRCWSDIIKAYGVENWDYPDPRCKKAKEMINNLDYF